jgi:hypothetical protein
MREKSEIHARFLPENLKGDLLVGLDGRVT